MQTNPAPVASAENKNPRSRCQQRFFHGFFFLVRRDMPQRYGGYANHPGNRLLPRGRRFNATSDSNLTPALRARNWDLTGGQPPTTCDCHSLRRQGTGCKSRLLAGDTGADRTNAIPPDWVGQGKTPWVCASTQYTVLRVVAGVVLVAGGRLGVSTRLFSLARQIPAAAMESHTTQNDTLIHEVFHDHGRSGFGRPICTTAHRHR
jgi:hypothetical protein